MAPPKVVPTSYQNHIKDKVRKIKNNIIILILDFFFFFLKLSRLSLYSNLAI